MNKKIYIIPSEKIATLDAYEFIAASGGTEGDGYETYPGDGKDGEEATARTQKVWDNLW